MFLECRSLFIIDHKNMKIKIYLYTYYENEELTLFNEL